MDYYSDIVITNYQCNIIIITTIIIIIIFVVM